jgi:hypothetical protein
VAFFFYALFNCTRWRVAPVSQADRGRRWLTISTRIIYWTGYYYKVATVSTGCI